jgi:hypothetical protein
MGYGFVVARQQTKRERLGAMNKVCHGEKRSDVAIQLEFQMDCRARQAGSQ